MLHIATTVLLHVALSLTASAGWWKGGDRREGARLEICEANKWEEKCHRLLILYSVEDNSLLFQ